MEHLYYFCQPRTPWVFVSALSGRVCINIATWNNGSGVRDMSVNFSNSFSKFSVKFGIFSKLYHEITHFPRELGWSLVIFHGLCWVRSWSSQVRSISLTWSMLSSVRALRVLQLPWCLFTVSMSKLLEQPVVATYHPFFVRKFCPQLPHIISLQLI